MQITYPISTPSPHRNGFHPTSLDNPNCNRYPIPSEYIQNSAISSRIIYTRFNSIIQKVIKLRIYVRSVPLCIIQFKRY